MTFFGERRIIYSISQLQLAYSPASTSITLKIDRFCQILSIFNIFHSKFASKSNLTRVKICPLTSEIWVISIRRIDRYRFFDNHVVRHGLRRFYTAYSIRQLQLASLSALTPFSYKPVVIWLLNQRTWHPSFSSSLSPLRYPPFFSALTVHCL